MFAVSSSGSCLRFGRGGGEDSVAPSSAVVPQGLDFGARASTAGTAAEGIAGSRAVVEERVALPVGGLRAGGLGERTARTREVLQDAATVLLFVIREDCGPLSRQHGQLLRRGGGGDNCTGYRSLRGRKSTLRRHVEWKTESREMKLSEIILAPALLPEK